MRIPKQARLPAPKGDYMPLQKGLDTETPQWQTAPGSARSSLNMEISINGGFRTHAGYERFDGQPKPSDAPYILLPTNITGEFSLGDTVTQLVSGATGLVIVVNSDNIVMTKTTGAFNDTDDLQVAAVTEGTANGERHALARQRAPEFACRRRRVAMRCCWEHDRYWTRQDESQVDVSDQVFSCRDRVSVPDDRNVVFARPEYPWWPADLVYVFCRHRAPTSPFLRGVGRNMATSQFRQEARLLA